MMCDRWEKNLEMLQSGALGDTTSPETLLRYWQMQERAGHPNASENVKYFADIVRKEINQYIDAKNKELREYVDKKFRKIGEMLEETE